MSEVEAWKYFAGQAVAGYMAGRTGAVTDEAVVEKAASVADEMTKLYKAKYLAITHTQLPNK
ncbi:hypothetical protein [Pseudomonas sp. 2995-3]|uniref:hypothetical protein n=1 Tax=Pseudomonas sp. 2995-3 TaxID=1712680 RepID=UPI000C15DF4B|nr:hypothetical protein [Pseudomonas sp. 2995-3]PIB69537.1 hypothetical protein AOA62_03990 [Pseudomonas sp. 2995-3]